MSWSFYAIGKASALVAEMDAQSEKLTGQCRLEFDDAKPSLAGLVMQNFQNRTGPGYSEPVLKIEASGSGSSENGSQMNRSCQVKIETVGCKILPGTA